MATPGLLAHIVVAKFEDALPFHRQSKQFTRLGIDLPRATLCNWSRQVAEAAMPLADPMDREMREGPIVNIDETSVQVLQEPGRAAPQKSFMWVFRGGDPKRPVLRYQYHPSRAGSVPLEYLSGFKGYVQTDGYNGYDGLGRKPGIVMVGCWAHARRKFHEVVKAAEPQVANESWQPKRPWSSSVGSTGSKKRLWLRSLPDRSSSNCASRRPNRCWRSSSAGWTKRRR
jgi:transposase